MESYAERYAMSDNACIYCAAPATRWCDLVIGFTDPDGDGLYSFDGGHEILTCDAPLCEDHADFQGNVFISGTPKVSCADSIDHCCGHREEGWAQDVAGGWYRNPDRFEPVSAEEAEGRRLRYRCAARPLRVVPAITPGKDVR